MSRGGGRIAELSEERRQLLDLLQTEGGAERTAGAPPRPRIQRRERRHEAPLSFAQERLWFLDQLQPGSPVYNIPSVLPLSGPLDAGALEASLNAIAERHEILRTTFVARDGEPRQLIAPGVRLPFRVVDCRRPTPEESWDEARRRMDLEAQRPFDLATGPLLRTTLLQLADEHHLLLVVQHHIVTDAWSMNVFFRELTALYGARVQGQAPPLPELPIQYGDYAQWQRRWLQGEVLERQIEYWKGRLAGSPGLLELPTDRPRPPLQTFNGALSPFVLPGELLAAVRELGSVERTTPFMTLLAAFFALLYRNTGQGDLSVGSPIANRNSSETAGLIGLFLNTLVLRVKLHAGTTFRRLLGRVRQATLEAYDHQELPFEMLVEELQPQRNLNVSPLFQVLFVQQSVEAPAAEAAAGAAEPAGAELPQATTGTAKFDLSLYLTDTGRELVGAWEYNTDLFFPTTPARLSRQLRGLLEAVTATPDRPLSGLALLPSAERQALLLEWNDTRAPQPSRRPHQMVAAQVEATPDAVALAAADAAISYRELRRRSHHLARRLQALGVGPEVAVGICAERSPEMVVGMLAILTAGAVHVPLDPAHPAARLAFMAADAGAPVLLAQQRLLPRLPETEAEVIPLDAGPGGPPGDGDGTIEADTLPQGLAYIIYTSGSTGWPKGVGMSLGTLSNLIAWQNALSPLGPGGRTVQFTSFSFDVSVLEILSTLSSHGTLVLPPEGLTGDLLGLARFLAERRVERMMLPYTALRHLAEAVDEGGGSELALRQVVSTGEALRITEPVARFFERQPGCTLHNEYGPTETHFVTELTLPPGPRSWATLPAIGRPISNGAVFVLDPRLRPLPIGVPGDLFAGGVTVARGYLGRPGLTAQRFLPDPWSGRQGGRLYRTGDLARWLPAGELEYLGREDHQVKIRGFRIEPGEVEAALSRHPAIEEAVVVARRLGGRREEVLVAYAVPRREPPSDTELRSFLLQGLPEPMVPTCFVMLDRLPLGATGKVDRLGLPEPELTRSGLTGAYVAPRGPMEERLAHLWSEILGVQRVGAHDDFFELGGHSLLATQIITRVRREFAVELPLRRLFEFPTVAELAVALVQQQIEEAEDGGDDLSALLTELEGLSPEEVQALLDGGSPA